MRRPPAAPLRFAYTEPPEPPEPYELLWLDDIEPILDAKDFVQGLLVEGGAGVVYGDSSVGKTFWMTDLALHVASRKEWNGRRVEQGGVIYCAMEGGNGFHNRVATWKRKHQVAGLPFAAIKSTVNLLDPDADTQRLIEAIKAAAQQMHVPVKLVVVDTLSRALAGGNENSPEDMGALVLNIDRIRAETGAFVIFVHHSGKDAARGARGHSLLRAAVDTEIEVRADEETGARAATVVKQRDLPKGDSFGFRLETIVLGQNRHGEDVTTCLVVPDDAVPAPAPAKARTKLTTTESGWFGQLKEMFADRFEPQMRSPAPGHPEMLTLTREQVRLGFRRRGRLANGDLTSALTSAERNRLSTMLNNLKDKGKVGLAGHLVWLP